MIKKFFTSTFIIGALSSLALQPIGVFPILFVTMPVLFLRLEKAESLKRSFILGWWFGFGFFVASFYWVAASLTIDLARFGWMIPFAITLLPAVVALYFGATTMTAKIFAKKGILLIYSLIGSWILFELARGSWFSGFPWNLLGYASFSLPGLEQLSSVVGVYGISGIILLISLIPIIFRIRKLDGIIISILSIAICISGYIWRQTEFDAVKELQIRLVQPNIPQDLKWDPTRSYAFFQKQLEMTALRPDEVLYDIVIWPEASISYPLNEYKDIRDVMSKYIPDNAKMIASSVYLEIDKPRRIKDALNMKDPKYYNAMQVLNSNGEIIHNYNKHRLVPFGEFVPLRNVFSFINKITPGDTDFSRGAGAKSIRLGDNNSFVPLICYESIFSGEIIEKATTPTWLLNVTNDAWYDDYLGPYQHLMHARMRAVENKIPMVRVANTGISAVIDGHGNILEQTEMNEQTVINTKLKLHKNPQTFYAKHGRLIPLLISLFLMLFVFIRQRY